MRYIPWYKQNIINIHNHSTATKFGNLITFLIPILNLFTIHIVGELLVGEIFLIILLPILIYKRKGLLLNKNLTVVIIFLLLWLSGQVITDLIRLIPSRDYLRGWTGIIFFLISIISLFLLLRTPLRILLFLIGLSIASFVRPFDLLPNEDFLVLWKFGVGSSILIILCLPFLWRLFKYPKKIKSLKYIILIHFIIGILSFFFNARSFAGITILTGLLLYLFYKKRGLLINRTKIIFFIFMGLFLSFGLLTIYSKGAQSGLFGVKAKEKYELQIGNSHDVSPLTILVAGRSEILVSSIAIADSPIIGHGSWAQDSKYTILYQKLRAKFKDESLQDVRKSKSSLIPTHSYLFGAWVFSGIFGAIFWIVILYYLIFKILPQAFYQASPLSIIFLLGFLNILWNILFSPFGSYIRLEVAFYIVAYFSLLYNKKNNERNYYEKISQNFHSNNII